MYSLPFGITILDSLLQPSRGGRNEEDPKRPLSADDSPGKCGVVISIEGPVGSGKSTLALHAARSHYKGPVLYLSTDWNFSQARLTFSRFKFDVDCPTPFRGFSSHRSPNTNKIGQRTQLVPLTISGGKNSTQPSGAPGSISVNDWLLQPVNDNEIGIVDLSQKDIGDEWEYVERVLTLFGSISQSKEDRNFGLVIIDSIPGLQTLTGGIDSFGGAFDSDTHINRLVRILGRKAHLLVTGANQSNSESAGREEAQSDIIYRIHLQKERDHLVRRISIAKARGFRHSLDHHLLDIRSGSPTYSSIHEDKDNPRIHQQYIHIDPSLGELLMAVKETLPKANDSSHNPKGNEPLAAFGIRFLDTLLKDSASSDNNRPHATGDHRGVACGTVTFLTGETGTLKSHLALAFAQHQFALVGRRMLWGMDYLLKSGALVEGDPKVDGNRWTQDLGESLKEILQSITGGGSPKDREIRLLSTLQGSISHNERLGEASDKVTRLAQEISHLTGYDAFSGWWCRFISDLDQRLPRKSIIITNRFLDYGDLCIQLAYAISSRSDYRIDQIGTQLERKKRGSGPLLKKTLRELMFRSIEWFALRNLHYRRIVGSDLEASRFFNIVRRYVEEYSAMGVNTCPTPGSWLTNRNGQSHDLRLVIDDLRAVEDVADEYEKTELRSLLTTYLARRKVTSLIVESSPAKDVNTGSRNNPIGRPHEHLTIRTWPVTFDNDRRVAIAVDPPQNVDTFGIVREVRLQTVDVAPVKAPHAGMLMPIVDPNLELYSGLPAGQPELVPLQIRLYSETMGWSDYIKEEANYLENVLRSPQVLAEGGRGNIVGVRPEDYGILKQTVTVPSAAGLPMTQVLQVDGFWAQQGISNLRPLGSYLRRSLGVVRREERELEDQLGSFITGGQNADPRTHRCRLDLFRVNNGLEGSSEVGDGELDRVPFTWDFGFVLGRWDIIRRAEESFQIPFQALRRESRVGRPVSWRDFIGACVKVARQHSAHTGRHFLPFALAVQHPNSLDTLLLEVWFSIAQQFTRNFHRQTFGRSRRDKGRIRLQDLIGDVSSLARMKGNLSRMNREPVGGYAIHFFYAWLLLTDGLDFGDPYHSSDGNGASPAIAYRHWFKTACDAVRQRARPEGMEGASFEAMALPGHYVGRGDWYLGMARGSRSVRLGELAIDALSSVPANRRRLELGLGLPVRELVPNEDPSALKDITTALFSDEKGGRLSLHALLNLGVKDERFAQTHWLWRSRIEAFDSQSASLKRWLISTVEWTRGALTARPDWIRHGGLNLYDSMTGPVSKWPTKAADAEFIEQFGDRLQSLVRLLNAASPTGR